MRRAPIVITATVLGTAGVLLFKPLATTSVASSGGGSTSTGASEPAAAAAPSDAATGDSTSATGSTAKDGTYTGDAETTRFGTTQVKVTIASGRITEIQVLQLNRNDPRSVSISESAAPVLRSEVLEAQTAAVDTVSGATYTSAAYEGSLQSALDRAGFVAADGSTASTDMSAVQESGGFGH